MSDLLGRVARWTVGLVYSLGYFGVAITVLAGNLHLPAPTGIVLPLAGFLIWQGRFSFVPVMIAATVGAVAGAFILYFVGRWFGEERLRWLFERAERIKFVSKVVSTSHLDKADEMFERHGGKAILIGHLIPGVGGFISIPAGVKRMPIWWRFTVYSVIGTIPYNVAHVILGWALGSQWRQAEQYVSNVKYVIPVAIVVAVLWYLLRRLERRVEVNLYGADGWERPERQGGGYLGDGQGDWSDGRPAARAVGTRAASFANMEPSPLREKSSQLFCRVATPEKVVYEGEADLVIARIADGYIGILANHAPSASTVEPGEVRVRQDGDRHIFAASAGFFKMSGNMVQILVEEAVPADEIDVDEAESRIEEAEQELSDLSPNGRGEEEGRRRAEIERRRSIAENLVHVARKYAED